MCMHETQSILRMTSPIVPTRSPEFLIASGIAKIPVPIFPFSKCIIVSQFLKYPFHHIISEISVYVALVISVNSAYEIACSLSSLWTSCTVSSKSSRYSSLSSITFTCCEVRLVDFSEYSACFFLSLGDVRRTVESSLGE